MQEFIPDAKTFYEMIADKSTSIDYEAFIEKYRIDLMKLWIFDIIIGNIDRNGGNFLIQGNTLYAIDHGYSLNDSYNNFVKNISLYFGFHHFFDEELPQELIEGIKNFLERPEEQQILKKLLTELFNKEFTATCLKRIKLIGEMLVKNRKIARPSDKDIHAGIDII